MISAILNALEQEEKQINRQSLKQYKRRRARHKIVFPPPPGIEYYRRNSFYATSNSPGAKRITESARHKYETDNKLLASRLNSVHTRKPNKPKSVRKLGINRSEERYMIAKKIRKENANLAKRLEALSPRSRVQVKKRKKVKKSKDKCKDMVLEDKEFELYCKLIGDKEKASNASLDFSANARPKPETYLNFSNGNKPTKLKDKEELRQYKRDNIRLYRRLSNVKSTIMVDPNIFSKISKQKAKKKQVKPVPPIKSNRKLSKTFKEEEDIILKKLNQEVSSKTAGVNDTEEDILPEKLKAKSKGRPKIPALNLNSSELLLKREQKREEYRKFDEKHPDSARIIKKFILSNKSKAFNDLRKNEKRLEELQELKSKPATSREAFNRSFKRRLSVGAGPSLVDQQNVEKHIKKVLDEAQVNATNQKLNIYRKV